MARINERSRDDNSSLRPGELKFERAVVTEERMFIADGAGRRTIVAARVTSNNLCARDSTF